MKYSSWLLAYLAGMYFYGIFSGTFPHQAWTNSNPDTFIHGGLIFAPAALIVEFMEWKRNAKKGGVDADAGKSTRQRRSGRG